MMISMVRSKTYNTWHDNNEIFNATVLRKMLHYAHSEKTNVLSHNHMLTNLSHKVTKRYRGICYYIHCLASSVDGWAYASVKKVLIEKLFQPVLNILIFPRTVKAEVD